MTTPLKAHLRTLISLNRQKIYFSPTSPLLVLSTRLKHDKLFGFTRPFDLNMKIYFKTTRGKTLCIPSRTSVRRCIVYHSRLSTLAASNKPPIVRSSKTIISTSNTCRVRRYLLVPRFGGNTKFQQTISTCMFLSMTLSLIHI